LEVGNKKVRVKPKFQTAVSANEVLGEMLQKIEEQHKPKEVWSKNSEKQSVYA